MFNEELIGLTEIRRTIRIRRTKIRQTIVPIFNAVTAGAHDIAEKLVRIVNRSLGIIHEPRMTHPPFLNKSGTLRIAWRPVLQLLNARFPLSQFGFCASSIPLEFSDAPVILGSEMVSQTFTAFACIYQPADCCEDRDHNNSYGYDLQSLHIFSARMKTLNKKLQITCQAAEARKTHRIYKMLKAFFSSQHFVRRNFAAVYCTPWSRRRPPFLQSL